MWFVVTENLVGFDQIKLSMTLKKIKVQFYELYCWKTLHHDFHRHFDNVKPQFIINKRTDACRRNNWRQLVKSTIFIENSRDTLWQELFSNCQHYCITAGFDGNYHSKLTSKNSVCSVWIGGDGESSYSLCELLTSKMHTWVKMNISNCPNILHKIGVERNFTLKEHSLDNNRKLKQHNSNGNKQKRHLKIKIWEMVTILWSLLLPRFLYCCQSTLQIDW